MEKEQRTLDINFEVREEEDKAPVIEGYAAKFGESTRIAGCYDEIIERGAFAESIEVSDIRALFNHNENYVIGRNKAGTLKVYEDDIGLRYEITPPDTQWANDLITSMRRGDINQSSFSFTVKDETWEEKTGEVPLRTIRKVDRLYDVSPVTYPAYPTTEASVRKAQELSKPKYNPNEARMRMRMKLMEVEN